MKQLMKEDLLILSRLFVGKQTQLVVLAEEKHADLPGIIQSTTQIERSIRTNPLTEYTIFNLLEKPLDEFYSVSNVKAILNFGKQKNKEELQFTYINNPDGTIRWIIPSTSKKPHFLNLYNSNGLRSKLIRQIFRFGWKTGLKKPLISGSFSLFCKGDWPLKSFIHAKEGNWSLFTGTVGPNRKIILELNDGNKTNQYVKIPVTLKSENLVENELNQLNKLGKYSLQYTETPTAKRQRTGLYLTNIKPQKTLNNISLKKQHFQAVKEWYEKSETQPPTNQLFEDIRSRITKLKTVNGKEHTALRKEKIKQMTTGLEKLYTAVTSKNNWKTGWCHGDFTPWNMFLSKNKIHVYDWEMAHPNRPLLYDLFHFVFQSGVLIKQSSFQAIESEIEQLEKQPIVQEIIQQFDLDFNQYKQFYLLHNISYYLVLYCSQQQLHKQANWLIQCWSDALDKEMMKMELKDRLTIQGKPAIIPG